MEARRRLALLSSHLRPVPTSATLPPASNSKPFSYVSPFSCSSSSLDADGGNLETGCVFCKIILGESPALKAFSHYTKSSFSFSASNSSTYSFNLLVNNGAPAGQVIFHTHLHIIPRKARDGLWTCESLPRHPLKLDQETSQLADRVCKELLFSENSEESMSQGSNLLANE
ncbi:adenylylsulfatase HINT3 isoform X3 [Diospyros lotus]|uniref:adenylylsulfatase HINT3 isoform X3 n=1 Tax=Diospyros lotus TaxID=55363 RepID=UPI002254B8E1|nr:adenylylsulfatase HINT3 isoform X3 [Diospyros lotus]